jgi:hypothetical protein
MPNDTLHELLWRRSALYVVTQIAFDQAIRSLSDSPSYAEYMAARFADPASKDLTDYVETLSEFIGTARSAGAELGILLYPLVPDYRDGHYTLGNLHDLILEVCSAYRIPCVDLRDPLFAVEEQSTLAVNRLDAHPSALANRIMTDAVLNAFEAQWIAQKDARATP